MALHFHKLKVKELRRETLDCVSVVLEIPDELKKDFAFTHGQSITIRIYDAQEEIRRSYSICSSPLEGELRIAIKKVSGGFFSTYANTTLKAGDVLDVMSPSGTFYTTLNSSNTKQYIAFVAGSGITPILSIIKTTLATEPGSSFTIIYGNKNTNSIIFKEALEALKNTYMERVILIHVLSRERTESDINYGRIDKNKCIQIGRLLKLSEFDEYFLCGPETLIFTVRDYLKSIGVDHKKIHFELFTTPVRKERSMAEQSIVQTASNFSTVTVKVDGRSFEFTLDADSNNILDAALAQGADLPFACKGGVCCTCKARLLEGKVEMEVNYGLEPDEVEAGFILTCQSHPRSAKVVVDFDVK